jgi:hypothetical protein
MIRLDRFLDFSQFRCDCQMLCFFALALICFNFYNDLSLLGDNPSVPEKEADHEWKRSKKAS